MTLQPLLNASLAIQIHVVAAVIAFLLGAFVLFRRKGDRVHRLGGKIWVLVMVIVAASSMFIHTIRLVGPWSPIHLVSLATLYFLVQAVRAAWQKRIDEHQRAMKQIYFGAVIGAGTFSFMPGRHMHEVFFGGGEPWVGAAILGAVGLVGVALLVRRVGWTSPPAAAMETKSIK